MKKTMGIHRVSFFVVAAILALSGASCDFLNPKEDPTLNGTWDYSWGDVSTRKGTFNIKEGGGGITGSADAGFALLGTYNSQTSYITLKYALGDTFIKGTVNADKNRIEGTYFQGQYINYPVTCTKR